MWMSKLYHLKTEESVKYENDKCLKEKNITFL